MNDVSADFLAIVDATQDEANFRIVLPLIPGAGAAFPSSEQLKEAGNDPRGPRAYWLGQIVGNDSVTPGHVLTAEEFNATWDLAELQPMPEELDTEGPGLHIFVSQNGGMIPADEVEAEIDFAKAMNEAMNDPSRHVIVPAGEYFLGDPSYAVPDDQWHPLLWSWADLSRPLGHMLDGTYIVAFPTAYGDGVYKDDHGHSYPVDAGLIGLVPITPGTEAALSENLTFFSERNADGWYDGGLMQRVKFEVPAHAVNIHGEMHFFESHLEAHDKGYVIDTRDYDATPIFGEQSEAVVAKVQEARARA
jgi:hypothetical protein